jgi:hypothetical protein
MNVDSAEPEGADWVARAVVKAVCTYLTLHRIDVLTRLLSATPAGLERCENDRGLTYTTLF